MATARRWLRGRDGDGGSGFGRDEPDGLTIPMPKNDDGADGEQGERPGGVRDGGDRQWRAGRSATPITGSENFRPIHLPKIRCATTASRAVR